MSNITNTRIQTKKETTKRRKQMDTVCYSLKIQSNKLSKKKSYRLHDFFNQARWLANAIIGSEDIFEYDYTLQQTQVKWFIDKEEFTEQRPLTLASQMKQGIKDQIIEDVKNLSKKQKTGAKIGILKFKKKVRCIPLKQFGTTWDFVTKNSIRIAKIGKVKVNGMKQIDEEIEEWGAAKLINDSSGYYIHITGFKEKAKPKCESTKNEVVGLDFGIKDNFTLSTGEKFNCSVPVGEDIKKLQHDQARKQKGSNNWLKDQKKINKKYEKINNQKEDYTNKLIHNLTTNFNAIVYQDDSFRGWHSGFYGKQVQSSCLGMMKNKLSKLNNSIEIGRFEPTTKQCYVCGRKQNIGLAERVYNCECGLVEDRDTKSAKTTAIFGLIKELALQDADDAANAANIPTVRRNFKPVERLSAGFIDSLIKEFKTDSVNQETPVFRQG